MRLVYLINDHSACVFLITSFLPHSRIKSLILLCRVLPSDTLHKVGPAHYQECDGKITFIEDMGGICRPNDNDNELTATKRGEI